ncbi:type II toxin-antitoxin system HipA family toxin [Maricurvus nonylphenolicus]|uniref:type II toxin-antitoxin system HipA family toxin n=1 Tax=Maricurvus nonylphenolicus TaxID=1008307 RepID=UPI0036F31A23
MAVAEIASEQIADVVLWGTRVGVVTWDVERQLGFFRYDPAFLNAPVEVAPLMMPKASKVYYFETLNRDSFKGLPGLLADALPDKFGNQLIDRWLVERDRDPASFSPVERLCYVGSRAMGALEFYPATDGVDVVSQTLQVDELVALANQVLSERQAFHTNLDKGGSAQALESILQVGTSAGGARAKAVIAWHPQTGEVRSGQVDNNEGFQYWLLKFDGVGNNRDKELADPQGFGRLEYAYYLMAQEAGINMADCRLMEEGGRAHFMTRRFDRPEVGGKLHMQSLCAMAHFDFNMAGAYSYEQALRVVRQLQMGDEHQALVQLYRRMVFNIVARNQDDHTKNIAFLMDRRGNWSLAPAFDVTYAYNPVGEWTSQHQMSANGKRDNFTEEDLIAVGKKADLTAARSRKIIDEVKSACEQWPHFAKQAGVDKAWREEVQSHFRLMV